MTWTDESHGTQTATVNTEHTLVTATTNATYEGAVDLSNLAIGETVEIRVKRKLLTGGSAIQCWKGSFTGGCIVNNVAPFPPIAAPFGVTVTLKQLSGTGRNFDWEVSRI